MQQILTTVVCVLFGIVGVTSRLLPSFDFLTDENVSTRRKLLLTCPDACDESPCECTNDQNCFNCDPSIGCSQCNNGYFKKDFDHPCTQCQDAFGDECLHCQDFHGCGQCVDGYNRIYDSFCELWYCEDAETDHNDLSAFSTGLNDAIKEKNLDESYFYDYLDYAIEFNKLTDYIVDGSDNYEELELRYVTYINSDNTVNSLNENYLSDVSNDLNVEIDIFEQALSELNLTNHTFYQHTMFSDLTTDERLTFLGAREDNFTNSTGDATVRRRNLLGRDDLTSVYSSSRESDYTVLWDYVGPIGDQGSPVSCGSCWAFGSTGQFEINYNKKIGNTSPYLTKFSEQYALDCSDANSDCDGGFEYNAALYFEDNGHCTENKYGSYTAEQESCGGCDEDYKAYSIDTKVIRPYGDFNQAVKQVSHGVAMQFRMKVYDSFWHIGETSPYYYKSGCKETNNNKYRGIHTMTIIGQERITSGGLFKKNDDWLLVRNSWGGGFAYHGYFWLHENTKNKCDTKYFVWSEFEDNLQPVADEFSLECIDECTDKPCTCGDNIYCFQSTCHDANGCDQCQNGYFQLSYNHPCVQCQQTVGDTCLHCQDQIGCGQCIDGYHVEYASECSLFICEAD